MAKSSTCSLVVRRHFVFLSICTLREIFFAVGICPFVCICIFPSCISNHTVTDTIVTPFRYSWWRVFIPLWIELGRQLLLVCALSQVLPLDIHLRKKQYFPNPLAAALTLAFHFVAFVLTLHCCFCFYLDSANTRTVLRLSDLATKHTCIYHQACRAKPAERIFDEESSRTDRATFDEEQDVCTIHNPRTALERTNTDPAANSVSKPYISLTSMCTPKDFTPRNIEA